MSKSIEEILLKCCFKLSCKILLLHYFRFNDHTRPACLPDASHRYTIGEVCYLPGWGSTASKTEYSLHFQQPTVYCFQYEKGEFHFKLVQIFVFNMFELDKVHSIRVNLTFVNVSSYW